MAIKKVKVARKILRDDVYEILLDKFLSGEYEPGAPISIDKLARELGISPTPVRETLVQMEHTGLVTRAALRGYRLAEPLSAAQMKQIVDARLILEVAAVERAMKHVDVLIPQLQEMCEVHKEIAMEVENAVISESLTLEKLRDYFDADWAFHKVFLENCGNDYIAKMVESLSFNIHRMRQNITHKDSDALEAVSEHTAILEAVESRDTVRVRHSMETHLFNVLNRSCRDSN